MAKLVCQTGPTAGHEYPLAKDLTVMGRQSACDIQILDNMSSRTHCQVRRDGKLYSVVDLSSRNGTHLNGKKVTERQLTFGDRIRVGEVEYLFVKEPGDVEIKDLLSKYEVQEKIGEGGMGIVYKANQRSMNRVVALKILSPKYSVRPRFVEQFIREARAAGQLNHPNIIQVHDVSTENDIHYFSMEFVDGPTCMQALRQQGPFKTPEALEIIRQTAKALEYAHAQRLIHQDIKPDNLMLGANNTVKLADLGISKTFDEAESDDGPKRVMGTPHYMAPEAALGKKIDHRVDIYSLGATLYHLLTGKTPYSGTSATEVLKAHVMDPLPAIQEFSPDVPDNVCALVERMVAKRPDDRYQTATEVVEEVQRLQAGSGLGTDRIGGNETMLLRRYAAGEAGAPSHPTPGAATTGKAHATGGETTSEHSPASSVGGLSRVMSILLALLVVAILGFGAWHLSNSRRNASENPAGSDPTANRPVPATPVRAPVDSGPSDADRSAAQATAIAELEDQLKNPGPRLDLNAMRTKVEELKAQDLQGANLERAKLLLDRLGQLLQQRHAEAVELDFGKLKQEALKLADERNFDLALNRLDAFKAKGDPLVKDRVAGVRDSIVKSRDTFLTNLRGKVQLAATQKNLVRLKELRDQLPPPLLGTPIEEEISQAMKTLEAEVLAQQQVVTQKAATTLAKWDFAGLDELAQNARAGLGDSPCGKQFDSYTQTARKLAQLITALDNQLKNSPQHLRYHGVLNGWPDPWLVSANAQGLQLQVVNGAIASPRWQEIPPDALTVIVNLVLPKDEAEQYRGAIQVLATVKVAAETKK
jgi:serine/threonine protein kinase